MSLLPTEVGPVVEDAAAIRALRYAHLGYPDSVRTIEPRHDDAAPADHRRLRIEVRVSPDQDALIRQAADLEGTTITAFVMDTTIARARRVLRQHQDLVLSNEAFDRFIAELDRPPEPVAELTDLFRSNPKLPGD